MTEWTPEAQERFFSELYGRVADADDEPEDVARKVASAVGGISRREMLAGAGILGGGALLGGGGTAALTGDAKAAASTTDGDGDIGTPDNPEDVFADALAVHDGANNQIGKFDENGIQTPSVDTDNAAIANAPTGDNDALRWQEGTEVGSVTVSGADNSTGDNNWGQGSLTSASTSFLNAFDATPKIALTVDGDNTSGWNPRDMFVNDTVNRSATGFDVNQYTMAAVDRSGASVVVDYVASEGR